MLTGSHLQGIGLMIASTLVANGATVYIIGPKQADLDECVPVMLYKGSIR